MKKLLVISKNFPPEVGGGIRRIDAVYKIFKEYKNIELTVVTAAANKSSGVISVGQRFFKDCEPADIIRFKNSIAKIKLVDKAFIGWMPFVLLKIIFKKYDYVFASTPSFTNIITAFIYKLLHFFKPVLIIEYRDFFAFNPTFYNNLNLKLIKILEKMIIKLSDYIIVTTGNMKKILSGFKNEEKIFLVRNYISQNDLNEAERLKKIETGNNYYNIGYIGKLNTGRNPENVLNIIKNHYNGKPVKLNFIGVNTAEEKWIKDKAAQLSLDEKQLAFEGNVERIKSLQYMKSFDGLLIIINNETKILDGYGIPGKLYDYSGINNNIFSDKESYLNLKNEFDLVLIREFNGFVNFKMPDANLLDNVFKEAVNKIIK